MISERTERLLTWIFVSGLFLYIVLRAVLVPITYDEASTFYRYINLGFYWPGDGLWDANNHILNSFLSIWSYRLFGVDEIWLRLPNVLAGALYLIMAVKTSQLLKSKWLKWMLILSLCCNHFVLEFFGVTRGYGLSMALMLTSLYYIFRWMKSGSVLTLTVGLISIQAATLANLSLLVANLLLFFAVAIWLIWKHREKLLVSLIPFGLSVFCIKWFVDLSFEYKVRGLLYYGSGKGFWESTIGSIAEFGFPAVEAVFPVFAGLALLLFVLVTAFYIIKIGITRKLLFGFIFWGGGLALVVMHHLLGVNYPEDRVAMHFLVLLPLGLVFLLDGTEPKPARWTASLVLFIIPINMVLSANLTHVQLWKEDACARDFYEEILRETKKTGVAPTIAGYRLRDFPLYYYGFMNEEPVTVIQDVAYQGNEAELQYAFLKEDGKWSDYDVVAYNKSADLHLLKRKNQLTQVLWDEQITPAQETSAEPYQVWYESDIDTIAGRDLLWDIEVQMPELKTPFRAWVTTVISSSQNETLMQESIVVDWLKPTWTQGEVLNQKILMPNIPEEASHIKIFFWNIDQKPIALGKARVRLVELRD